MYRSPILKKTVEILYTSSPWRIAITLPWFNQESYNPGSNLIPLDGDGTASPPPTSFVAFAASAVSLPE